jgi:hypothetical protein
VAVSLAERLELHQSQRIGHLLLLLLLLQRVQCRAIRVAQGLQLHQTQLARHRMLLLLLLIALDSLHWG